MFTASTCFNQHASLGLDDVIVMFTSADVRNHGMETNGENVKQHSSEQPRTTFNYSSHFS